MVANQTVVLRVMKMRKVLELMLITVVGHLKAGRQVAKASFAADYSEIYIVTRIHTLDRRDTKDSYSWAEGGEINNFIRLDNGIVYQTPIDPELLIGADIRRISISVNRLVTLICSCCNGNNHYCLTFE